MTVAVAVAAETTTEELRLKIEKEAEKASQAARPQWEELLQLLEPHLPAIEAKQQEVKALARETDSSFEKVARKWWAWWSIGKSSRHAETLMNRLEADVFPAEWSKVGEKRVGHKFALGAKLGDGAAVTAF